MADSLSPVTIGEDSGVVHGNLAVPFAGRVYAAQVRNGIGGTVVVNPDFSRPTEWPDGATSATDRAGAARTLDAADDLVARYGNSPSDWAKMRSGSYRGSGHTFETHWYENFTTGQRVEYKTKFPGQVAMAAADTGSLVLTSARWKLGLIAPDALIEEASFLLDVGIESPALLALAEVRPTKATSRAVVGPLLEEALKELGIPPVSDREAGELVARDIASDIASGALDPYEGARQIWWDICHRVPELGERLAVFIGLASEWEDDIPHRAKYEEDIRRAAAELTITA